MKYARKLMSCGTAMVAVVAAPAIAQAPVNFDIASQSLPSALEQVARQGSFQVLSSPRLTADKRGSAVRARLAPEVALAQLLIGTGLTYQRSGGGFVIVAARPIQRMAMAGQAPAGSSTGLDDDSGASMALEDIVVTARYTRESVQKTPISIANISSAKLEQEGVSSLADVSKLTSGVTFIEGGSKNGKSLGALIRGVGQIDPSTALQPGVGIYIDDVYFGTVFGASQELGDVDRVEILKGPQGTLFGRNNEGGAVRIFNKLPQGDNSGYVEIAAGNYNARKVKGTIDLRLSDTLFVRATGAHSSRNGYVDQIDFACENPALAGNIKPIAVNGKCKVGAAGASDVDYVRVAARFQPTDGLEINISGDWTDDRGNFAAARTVSINTANPVLRMRNQSVNIPFYGIPVDGRFLTNSIYKTYATDATFTDQVSGVYAKPVNSVKGGGITGTVDWDVGGAHVKFIGAYRKFDGEFAFKQGGSPIWVVGQSTQVSHNQKSGELRVTGGAFDKALEWTVGAYYYDGHELTTGPVNLSVLPTPFPFVFSNNNPSDSTSKSAFLHGVYHVTDKLSVEGGMRYTRDSAAYVFDETLIAIGAPLVPLTRTAVKDSHVDPKLAVQYQFTDRIMGYASAARGYRAGGGNPRPLNALQVTTFDPEELTQYEIGLKSEFLDRRVRLNIAAYYSDYKNLQQLIETVDLSGTPAQLYSNVGKARIQGVEVELQARPTAGWLFEASVSALDYKTLELGAAAIPGGPTLDTMAQGVPKYQSYGAIEYSASVAGGTGSIRLSGSYQSRTWFDAPNSPLASQAGYALLNGRIGWQSKDADWEASLQVNNLLGKKYYTSFWNNDTAWGIVEGQVGEPRMVMFSVRRNF